MFRFTIRDVLWLTVVVAVALAMGVSWRNDRYHYNAQRHRDMTEWLDFHHKRMKGITEACDERVRLMREHYLKSREEGDSAAADSN